MSEDLRTHYRNLTLAALGAVFEYYDFIVFVFVAAAISEAFFPPDISPWVRQIQTFSIYAVGYLIRPVAGITIAHFADRIGRKKLFVFNVVLMSVPTFCIGLLPTYAQVGLAAPLLLVVMRIFQGCAMGGEIPSAAVFVSEHAPPSRLNFTSGTLHMVQHFGLLFGMAGAALGSFVASLDPSLSFLSWRLPFLIGGALGLFAAYLRRSLEETPLFVKLREERMISERAPLKVVITQHAKACLIGLALLLVLSFVAGTYYQYLVTYLVTQFHVPQSTVFIANIVGVLAFAIPMPFWGLLADRIGQEKVIVAGAMLSALVTFWFFTTLPSHIGDATTLSLSFIPVGLCCGIVIALIPGLLASLFPTAVRQSGYAFPYNVGAAVFAGLTPLALSVLIRDYGLMSPMYYVLVACAVALLIGFVLRGTRRYLGPIALAEHVEIAQGREPSKATYAVQEGAAARLKHARTLL
jgi:MFS family permease